MANATSVAPAPVERSPGAARRSGLPAVAGALAVIVLTLVAAVGVYFAGPYAAGVAGGPPPAWHAGSSPPAPSPVLPVADGQAPVPAPDGVSGALAPLISAAGLGGHVALSVVDAATGRSLFAEDPETAMVPASTAKIVTAATVLASRGAAYQLTTRAVAGANPGEVVLVGGGDPTLSATSGGPYPGAARLDDLAAQVRRSLGGTAPTKVSYDASLFPGDQTGPGWDPDIASGGFAAPITALMIDAGRVNPRQVKVPAARAAQPDLAAAQAFAKALGLPSSAVTAGTAPSGARELGSVASPPLVRLVEIMLSESDNVIAEALARQVAIARKQPATFAGAAGAMRDTLGDLGVPTGGYALVDGSGLSRDDRLTPALLTGVLAAAARPDRADLRGLLTGLPVAGYSGTLRDRYRSPDDGASAAGSVRAKTGTLTGVSSIAGIVIDADGRTLVFAVLADAVNKGTAAAQEALDRIAAALAGCGCR